jgi:hypothetical protein
MYRTKQQQWQAKKRSGDMVITIITIITTTTTTIITI